MPGIKSDRTHRAEAHSRKERGIMGVSVALARSPLELYQPSGCSVTPSLQIPSSLRQFHSPLPASVTQSLFTLPSRYPLGPQTYIIPLLPRVSAPLWHRDAASRNSFIFRPPGRAQRLTLITCASARRPPWSPPRTQTETHICASRPSDVHRHTLS